jgi:glycosyltransferase involved in cell wall biosynthesis
VLAQTYGDLEILVLDNASTDDTRQVVEEIARRDSRLRYLRHQHNIGMVANFSACIEQARGEYLKFVCADDALEPQCVERMVEIMSARPRVALAACGRRLMDGASRVVGAAAYSRRFVVCDGAAAARRCFFRGNVIGEPTAVLFRRADAARGFDGGYRQLIDLEMWLYLLGRGQLAFLPEPLCRVRRHAQQASVRHLESGLVL